MSVKVAAAAVATVSVAVAGLMVLQCVSVAVVDIPSRLKNSLLVCLFLKRDNVL